MWTESSKYYDEGFKRTVVFFIRQERDKFRLNCSRINYVEFGRRFEDDEQVWQAFCSHVAGINNMMNRPSREKALQVEMWYSDRETEMVDVVWKALHTAAELDWHYKYEKRFDGPERTEEVES